MVGFVVLWPSPVDLDSQRLIVRILKALRTRGFPSEVTYAVVEFTANIVMFVPLGFLLALLFGRRLWWAAALVCLGLSAGIELYQFVSLPARYATLQDVIANTSGGLAGALIAAPLIFQLTFPRRMRLPRFPRAPGLDGPAPLL